LNLYCVLVWTDISNIDPQVHFVVADTQHKATVIAKKEAISFLKECGFSRFDSDYFSTEVTLVTNAVDSSGNQYTVKAV
jgi:hypothetical protein